jgi:hypothetical protein
MIWQPPSETWKALPNGTIPKPMITSLSVAEYPITLGETRLSDLQKRFGGAIGTKGDAGDFLQWLCFANGNHSRPWVLWLESGEMDDGTVAGFHWSRLAREAKVDGRCRQLGESEARVQLPLAIRPAMVEKEVFAILGSPTARKGNSRLYVHEHEESVKGETFFNTNTVELSLRNGRLTSIGVWNSTTN